MKSKEFIKESAGYREHDQESFWDGVVTEISNHTIVSDAYVEHFEFDDNGSERNIIIHIDMESGETYKLDMLHSWNDDGTYGKPKQEWMLSSYPEGNLVSDDRYRVEVYDKSDEANKIIHYVADAV